MAQLVDAASWCLRARSVSLKEEEAVLKPKNSSNILSKVVYLRLSKMNHFYSSTYLQIYFDSLEMEKFSSAEILCIFINGVTLFVQFATMCRGMVRSTSIPFTFAIGLNISAVMLFDPRFPTRIIYPGALYQLKVIYKASYN